MLSPAQPSPAPAPPGKKCIIFRFSFWQRYSRTVKSCCSKIEKIKLVDPPNFQWKSMFLHDFSSQFWTSKNQHAGLAMGHQGAICAVVTWWFFHVFRVLPDPLQDRRVDFLTLNLDEKSCYFRVFFACFLTHCETEVLIFWRSISTKNRVIFVCFSRAFWPIARPACWFFRVTRSVGF